MSKHATTATPEQPIARMRVGSYFQRRLALYPDRIERGKESHPLTGVRAEAHGAGLRSNRTLVVSGRGFAWSYHVHLLLEYRVRRFAALIGQTVADFEADRT